jgi:Protein of unknown function (DUF732)
MDERTRASDIPEDETQSIHAWSQSDDADTVIDYKQHRGWKIPALVAVIAAFAAVTAGAFLMWPHSAAQQQAVPTKAEVAAPQPNPAPPAPKPESKDDLYVRLLKEKGIPVGTPEVVASNGRGICIRIKNGETEQQMVRDIIAGSNGVTTQQAWIWADTAIEVYCPPA